MATFLASIYSCLSPIEPSATSATDHSIDIHASLETQTHQTGQYDKQIAFMDAPRAVAQQHYNPFSPPW